MFFVLCDLGFKSFEEVLSFVGDALHVHVWRFEVSAESLIQEVAGGLDVVGLILALTQIYREFLCI